MLSQNIFIPLLLYDTHFHLYVNEVQWKTPGDNMCSHRGARGEKVKGVTSIVFYFMELLL